MAPKILIAEDNDSFAAFLETLLVRRGLVVERVADGQEAICRIAAAPPAVLLLDLQLPKLNGVELLKKLRQAPRTKKLPVIIMTGVYRGERFVKAAQALGVQYYLEKPFRTEALLEALRKSLPSAKPIGQPFARHLLQAFTRRFSGRCRLRNGNGVWDLFFVHGNPVAVQPGFAHRDFGDFLQHRGILSAEEYEYLTTGGGSHEEAAVRMGCLDPSALLREKVRFLHHELVSAFAQPPLTVEAQPIQLPPEVQLSTVNLPEIIREGLRRQPDPLAGTFLASRGKHYVAVTREYFHQINFLSLNDEERQLLSRLDGTRMLADCLESRQEGLGLMRTLDLLGMVRYAEVPFAPEVVDFPQRPLFTSIDAEEALPATKEALESFADLIDEAAAVTDLPESPPSLPSQTQAEDSSLEERVRDTLAGMEGKNYYEIFGLSQQKFSFDRLKERYFALTREFGPDILMQLGGKEAAMVEKILDAVSAAYNTLSDVVKKERYDELLGSDKIGLGRKGDDQFQAQVQFQSGKVFLDMEEWDSAEKSLQDACNIDPQNSLYMAHLAWAIYSNPANANSRAMLEKSKQMLNRSLTLERTAEAFAFKGKILLEGGQEGLAEMEFNKSLRLNARLSLARTGLRQIQEKREQESKGLFRRIFK
jgi:CheY-like chemotaxis protein/curved DNA-binding protein CbpA